MAKIIQKSNKNYIQTEAYSVIYNIEEGLTLTLEQQNHLEDVVYMTQNAFKTDVYCVWINKSMDSTDDRLHNINIVFDKAINIEEQK
jgi:hypothetical protein